MQVACVHSLPFGHPHLTTCALGLGNHHPSRGVCEKLCRLGTRQHLVLPREELQSTPEGARRRARQMYPAPTLEQIAAIRAQHAVPKPWPLLVRALTWLAKPGDRGIGDVVKRLANVVDADTMAAWFTRITGEECHCESRRAILNQRYPFTAALLPAATPAPTAVPTPPAAPPPAT